VKDNILHVFKDFMLEKSLKKISKAAIFLLYSYRFFVIQKIKSMMKSFKIQNSAQIQCGRQNIFIV
jgi:hypothetical protein